MLAVAPRRAARADARLGRIRRVGGTKAVQHLVLAANTVEDRVADKLERKIGNIEALNDRDLER